MIFLAFAGNLVASSEAYQGVMNVTNALKPDKPPPQTTVPPSFDDFYSQRWRRAVRLAALMTKDVAAAEDIVQESFLVLHRKWDMFSEDHEAQAYLTTVVVNRCRKRMRKIATRLRKEPLLASSARLSAPSILEIVGPERDMWHAIDSLPRRMREVIILRYYADLTELQIAKTLSISPGTVKSTASKALKKLRPLLEGQQL